MEVPPKNRDQPRGLQHFVAWWPGSATTFAARAGGRCSRLAYLVPATRASENASTKCRDPKPPGRKCVHQRLGVAFLLGGFGQGWSALTWLRPRFDGIVCAETPTPQGSNA